MSKSRALARLRSGHIKHHSLEVHDAGKGFSLTFAEWRGRRLVTVTVTFDDYAILDLLDAAKKVVAKRRDYAATLEGYLAR